MTAYTNQSADRLEVNASIHLQGLPNVDLIHVQSYDTHGEKTAGHSLLPVSAKQEKF